MALLDIFSDLYSTFVPFFIFVIVFSLGYGFVGWGALGIDSLWLSLPMLMVMICFMYDVRCNITQYFVDREGC